MLNIPRFLAKIIIILLLSISSRAFAVDVDYEEVSPYTGVPDATRTDSSVQEAVDETHLKLDGSNANTTIDIGSENFTTTGTATISGIVIPTIFDDMAEPTGFENRTDSTLSFVDGTRTLTITGTDFGVYFNGVKVLKNTESIVVDDTTGIHWIYYDKDTQAISQATTSPAFDHPFIATLYYNTVIDLGLLGDERHNIVMDWHTHTLMHYTVGTRYESGLTGTFGDTTFDTTSGIIDDEDIAHAIGAETTCDILYKDGAADFKWLLAQTQYYYKPTTTIYYNNGNVLTVVPSNQYVAYWIFATNDTTTPIVSLMGQRVDTNIAGARANNKYESLTLGTLPFQEMKILYRVILRNDATPYEETQDLRIVSNLPAGTYIATDHGLLTGLTDDDHTQYWLAGTARTGNFDTSGTLDVSGLGTFDKVPIGTGVAGGSLYVNPASATADRTLFGVALNGGSRFRVDEDGDAFLAGYLTLPGFANSQTIYGGDGTTWDLTDATVNVEGLLVQGTLNAQTATMSDIAAAGSRVTFANNVWMGFGTTVSWSGDPRPSISSLTNCHLDLTADESIDLNSPIVITSGYVDAALGFKDNGSAGIDGSWVNAEGDTVTVSGGLITAITPP